MSLRVPRIPSLKPTEPGRRMLVGAGIGLLVALAVALLKSTAALTGFENALIDKRTRSHLDSRPPDPRIVLATVQTEDIEDLKKEGHLWPWDLEVNALAYRWMAAAGAKAILVDVFQFDRGSGPEELDPSNPARREMGEGQARDADALAAAYAAAGNVVLAIELVDLQSSQPPWALDVRRPAFEHLIEGVPRIGTVPGFARERVNLPVVRLLKAAAGVGFANTTPDEDGVMRRSVAVARGEGRPLLSLPLAAAIRVTPGPWEFRERSVSLGSATQPLGPRGSFFVNYRGKADTYPKVRPCDLVRAGAALSDAGGRDSGAPVPDFGTATVAAVRGRIVVWGVNAGGVKDVVSVPVGESEGDRNNFPGPEFQATVLDNFLNGDGRVPASPATNGGILFLGCVVLGAIGGRGFRKGVYPLLVVVASAGLVFVGYRLFSKGTVIDLFAPVLGFTLTYAASVGYRLFTEGVRNRWLEGTFGKYLAPAVIEALKKNPELIRLGGRRREITVFFSDVKQFTHISESLSSEQLVTLLNRYLTRQSAEVLGEEGVIDKFIGDAVMAFFGEPIPHEDHALRACKAAVRCVRALPDLDPLAHELKIPPLVNRVGINTGEAHVGNMGSESRFDYTCMGDTVNFASRLEGANKAFGTRILIGPRTYEMAQRQIVAKPLAAVQVVGKTKPVQDYELLATHAESTPAMVQHVAAFARAREALMADDLDEARAAIAEAERAYPRQGSTTWLVGILEELESGKTDRPWDGVVVLESK